MDEVTTARLAPLYRAYLAAVNARFDGSTIEFASSELEEAVKAPMSAALKAIALDIVAEGKPEELVPLAADLVKAYANTCVPGKLLHLIEMAQNLFETAPAEHPHYRQIQHTATEVYVQYRIVVRNIALAEIRLEELLRPELRQAAEAAGPLRLEELTGFEWYAARADEAE